MSDKPTDFRPNICNIRSINPLKIISNWMQENNTMFQIYGSNTYCAKTFEEHSTVFQTKNKDYNSIIVFERVAPRSVFNQQEVTWENIRKKHPYTLLGKKWLVEQRLNIDEIVLTRFSKLNKCDLYDTIYDLVFEIISYTTFGFVDWKSYKYFNYQIQSVDRQLMYSIRPLSPWYYYGRNKWFTFILKAIQRAKRGSVVDKLKPYNEHYFGELSGLYWGGIFSLSNLITCSIYHICKNKGELEELLKNPSETVIKIMKESLRICSGAPLLTRTLDHNLTVGPYEIKKNSDVIVCPYALHKDTNYWNDPNEFNSTRHNSDNNSNDAYYHNGYMPFGVPIENGGRACVARDFALMVAERVLITMFTNFNITLDTTNEYEVKPYCGSVKPIHKYSLNITKRLSKN